MSVKRASFNVGGAEGSLDSSLGGLKDDLSGLGGDKQVCLTPPIAAGSASFGHNGDHLMVSYDAVTLDVKIAVPVDKYPEFNFIGRLLGPRGMTVKQLEQETGCKILIRGQGSVKNPEREKRLRGRPGWEHLTEEQHVYIKAIDNCKERAQAKLNAAIERVRELLSPVTSNDQLKRRQLMELAIINGNYRPNVGRAHDLNGLCKPAAFMMPQAMPPFLGM